MQEYEILPHTADVRLKVSAKHMDGIFESALEGMSYIISNNCFESDKGINLTENINIDSLDESMLLIDFLSVILTLSHKNKAVYRIKTIRELSKTSISVIVEGKKLNGFDEDIKAVTYTEAQIVKNRSGMYETIIVFDI